MTKPRKEQPARAAKRDSKPQYLAQPASSHKAVPASDDDDILKTLAQEMLGVCAPALKSFAANPGSRTLKLLQSYPSGARFARQMLEGAGLASKIHTRWQSDPGYVDGDGHPRVIQRRGPSPSFQALCRDCGVAARSEELLEWACRFGLCRRLKGDRLAYISDTTLLTGHRALMLARAVVTIDRFLGTSIHNAKQRRHNIGPLGDRTTQVRVADVQFPQVAKLTRRFLSTFIESSDRQLYALAPRGRRSPKRGTRWCGVTAFVFRDP